MAIFVVDNPTLDAFGSPKYPTAAEDAARDLATVGRASFNMGRGPARPGELWYSAEPEPNRIAVVPAGFDGLNSGDGPLSVHAILYSQLITPALDQGATVLSALVNLFTADGSSNINIFIYNRPGYEYYPSGRFENKPLCEQPGVSTPESNDSIRNWAIVYDQSGGATIGDDPSGKPPCPDCDRRKYYSLTPTFDYAPCPSDEILFHELDHIYRQLVLPGPSDRNQEDVVNEDEGDYNQQHGRARLAELSQLLGAPLMPGQTTELPLLRMCFAPPPPSPRAVNTGNAQALAAGRAWWRYKEASPGTLTYHSPRGNEYETTFPRWAGGQSGRIDFDYATSVAGIDFVLRTNIIHFAVEAAPDHFEPPTANNFNVTDSYPIGQIPAPISGSPPGTGPRQSPTTHLNVWRMDYLAEPRNQSGKYNYKTVLYYRYPGKMEISSDYEFKDQMTAAPSNYPYYYKDFKALYDTAKRHNYSDDLLRGITRQLTATGDVYEPPSDKNWNPPGSPACLVAESHPAGRDAAALNELRVLRQEFLLGTPWGRRLIGRFHKHYYSFSTEVARQLSGDNEMRDAIGFAIAAPIINYLRMVVSMPRFEPQDINRIPAPFRKFVHSILVDVDHWLDGIDVGSDLSGLTCAEAAIEIAIALRFRFRTSDERSRYLRKLIGEGVLPLMGTANELATAEAAMRALGTPDHELFSVLGQALGGVIGPRGEGG